MKYEVEEYQMTGGEIDTFYKLFWYGDQDDGDLPSKVGMDLLIEKGLAVKNYHLEVNEIYPIKPNYLTIKGYKVARDYYRKKYLEYKKLKAR